MRYGPIPPLLVTLALVVVACGDGPTHPVPVGRVALTHAPLDLSGAESYIGIGDPNVLPKAHGGFPLLNPYVLPAAVPVFAVADGVVINVRLGTRTVPDWGPPDTRGQSYEDWSFEIRLSTTMQANYAHVSRLHPDFQAKVGNPPADEIGRRASIPVQAGEILGYVGPHAAMDFSLRDREKSHQFLNTSRYPVDYIYAVDITEYFAEPVRSEILAITPRQIPPRGGKHDHDIAGRIVGNWFREGTTSFTQWSRQLAIVYHHIEADRIVISDGSPMTDGGGLTAGAPDVWLVRGNAPDPATVGEEHGLVKYELIPQNPWAPEEVLPTEGTMLAQLIGPGTLRVEVFRGSLPDQVQTFTSAAHNYVR